MLERIPGALVANWGLILLAGLTVALILSGAARKGARAILRLLVYPLMLVAVIALIYDGTRILAGEAGPVMTSAAQHWSTLAPAGFEAAKTTVSRRLSPALWDPAMMSLLRLPAWLLFGALGLLASYLGRRRTTVNVYAN
jgi:hypothetical protein